MVIEPKTLTQQCIDARYALEALRTIPKSITVESMQFRLNSGFKRRRMAVPNRLKILGVNHMSERLSAIECQGVIANMARKHMWDAIKGVAKEMNVEPETIECKHVRLVYKDATASFTRVTKGLHPDEKDQRKKAHVLGLTWSEGNIASMLAELNAKKFCCTFEVVPVRRVICTSVK